MLELVGINTNYIESKSYNIKLFYGNTILGTKESLKSSNVLDISSIPIFSENYINESNNLTQEKLKT